MTDKQEYILCAAIKRIEPKSCIPYHEGTNDICNIEIGYRHHDILQRFVGEVSKNSKDQGFYTSMGRFVDRKEAMLIAWKAEQVSAKKAFGGNFNSIENIIENSSDDFLFHYIYPLYSEDLY
jgi:hypothetical protein